MSAWRALVAGVLTALAPLALGAERTLLGYTAQGSTAQAAIERELQQQVRAESIAEQHRLLTAHPHPAGSPAAHEVANHLARTLSGFGLEVERHEYRAWLSQPRRVEVSLTAPQPRALSLREPVLPGDPTSAHPALGPGYIAYSASGDVQGEVIYANYGLPEDYAELERHGVSARGRIVLARYGRSHRAVKVFTAQQAGAQALVLFSDPADDGFVHGTPWPEGYWRGEQMLQRGNAKLSWYFHGDPLTPGIAATAEAERLEPATAPPLPRIPVVAIGWGEARHVLAALEGPVAPAAFRGGVPLEYRLGPGPATLHLAVEMEDGLRPIRNVIATLRGAVQPERVVMLGGHHDAWTFGAVDPGTATAAQLEVARVLGAMAKAGSRPRRSIQFAFWDAEEFGLVGSTEHAEQFFRALQEQLVLYVNTDMTTQGRFDPGGVPSLGDFVIDVARSVPSTQGRTVFDEWTASVTPKLRRADGLPGLEPLGSGADFVPFQDHLGVPTLAIEFIGENGYGYGTYHSNFDSRAYVERIADPGFRHGATLAQTLGTLALRMANAHVLPFRFVPYAGALLAAVEAAGETLHEARYPAADNATAEMRLQATRLQATAAALQHALDARLARGELPETTARALNDGLARAEQLLADDEGAPERGWYRHVYHGWNIYSLYDGQPFAGLMEAVRTADAARIAIEIGRIEGALGRMSSALDDARRLLEGDAVPAQP